MLNVASLERFYAQVRIVPDETSCWEWTGYIAPPPDGYAKFWMRATDPGGLAHLKAMRAIWLLTYNFIPDGWEVCHTCDNPICVRLGHLFVDTHDANMKDMSKKGRHRGGASFGRFIGEGSPRAILTWVIVREIRALYASGKHKQTEIASMYGIRQGQVSAIVLGKAWKE